MRLRSLGDLLYSIYFIRGGQMEILQNNESQAILARNDTLGENTCNTVTPGKSRCVVKGIEDSMIRLRSCMKIEFRFNVFYTE